MNTHKMSVVHGDWRCDACLYAKSKTVKFNGGQDWFRWSEIARLAPKHTCPEGGVLHLQSVQWIES